MHSRSPPPPPVHTRNTGGRGGEPTAEYVDVDGDGYEESAVLDTDGDGYVDTVLSDTDGDGEVDLAAFDNDPDGEFVADVVAVDVDGDGDADVVADDTDLDGVFDTTTYDAGVPVEDANPYGPSGGYAEPGAEAASGSGQGSVIAGEGGDALYVDPDGGVSFSGSDSAGGTYSYDGT